MSEETTPANTVLIELTVEIVRAYVSKNSMRAAGLPELIASVHAAVSSLGGQTAEQAAPLTPAVNPKKSVFPDYIICLEDGKKFKSLKRHLTVLGLTPDEYRTKWGLAAAYPMVATNYAAARSELAKKMGLGRKPTVAAPAKAKRGKKGGLAVSFQ